MTTEIRILPVTPIATRRGMAFASFENGSSGVIERDFHEYPPSPRGAKLRDARFRQACTLGRLARAIGIGTAELSGLERGSNTTDESGWRACYEALGVEERR
jgi:hypothetical protein